MALDIEKAKATMLELNGLADQYFEIIDRYNMCREGGYIVKKIEEALLWSQVLVMNIPLKNAEQETISDVKVEETLSPNIDDE